MNNCKAVILAGGRGSRLYPVTYGIPKPLLPVGKKPIINYLIELFRSQGIRDIAVLINKDFKEDFKWWLKRYYPGEKRIKIFQEKEPLGTLGGFHLFKRWLSGKYFFLSNGDELKKLNLSEMMDFHKKRGGVATVGLFEVPDPSPYGVAVLEKGKIKEFLEKPENPPSNCISAGLYLFSPEVFDYYLGPKFSMIETDILPKLAKENKLGGFKFRGNWMDCGTFERYGRANLEWK